jgi:hypothetical protein
MWSKGKKWKDDLVRALEMSMAYGCFRSAGIEIKAMMIAYKEE